MRYRIMVIASLLALVSAGALSAGANSTVGALGAQLYAVTCPDVQVALATVSTDNVDTDADHLSDCLETEMLGTASNVADTDLDNIVDGLDLVPQEALGEISIPVSIAKFKEGSKHCDPRASKYWDPIISTGFVNLPDFVQGTNKATFPKTGYTEGDHKHDKREHEPASLEVVVKAPEDINLIQREGLLDFPMFNLVFGLADHDVTEWGTNGVPLTEEGDIDDMLHMVQLKNGRHLTVTYEGSGDCHALLQVIVKSPITLEQMLAAVRVSADWDLVKATDVAAAAAATEADFSARGMILEESTQYALGGMEGLLYEPQAAAEWIYVDEPEHTIYHYLNIPPLTSPCQIVSMVVGNTRVTTTEEPLVLDGGRDYIIERTVTDPALGTDTDVLRFHAGDSTRWNVWIPPLEFDAEWCEQATEPNVGITMTRADTGDVVIAEDFLLSMDAVQSASEDAAPYIMVQALVDAADVGYGRVLTSWDDNTESNFWTVWDAPPS